MPKPKPTPKPMPKPKAAPKPKKPSEEDAYFADLQNRLRPQLQAKQVSPFAPKPESPEVTARKKMQQRSNQRLEDVNKKGLAGRRKAIDNL